MKNLLTLGLTTALLTTTLMGSAAFADTNIKTKLAESTNGVISVTLENGGEDDFLKFHKNIMSEEDFALLEQYEKEIDKALKSGNRKDEDAIFVNMDKLLTKYDGKILKAEKAFTSKDIFEIFGDGIKSENKDKIKTLSVALDKYKAAGDVTNYEKTLDEIEKLLPNYSFSIGNLDFDQIGYIKDTEYMEKMKKILSKEDFALYEKYEKEIEKNFEAGDIKEDDAIFDKIDNLLEKYESELLKIEEEYTATEIFEYYGDNLNSENKTKIEALAKTLEEYRVSGDVANYEKTFDEIEKLLPEFDDYNESDFKISSGFLLPGKALTDKEKKEIESLFIQLDKLEESDDFDKADKIYEKIDELLFD